MEKIIKGLLFINLYSLFLITKIRKIIEDKLIIKSGKKGPQIKKGTIEIMVN